MPLTEPKRTDGRPFFCGPRAVCAITGKTQDQVEREFRRIRRNRKPIKATWAGEVHRVLRTFGYHCYLSFNEGRTPVTLAKWLDNHRGMSDVYLVEITGHWLVVHGRRICDWHGLIPPEKYPNRRAWVRRAWKVASQ